MRDLTREKKQQLMFSPVSLGILSIILILLFISLIGMIKKSRTTSDAEARYREDLEQLERQESTLQADLEYFETERGLEAEIRDRFPVAKEGEEIIIIVDEEIDELPETEEKQGFFKRLFR